MSDSGAHSAGATEDVNRFCRSEWTIAKCRAAYRKKVAAVNADQKRRRAELIAHIKDAGKEAVAVDVEGRRMVFRVANVGRLARPDDAARDRLLAAVWDEAAGLTLATGSDDAADIAKRMSDVAAAEVRTRWPRKFTETLKVTETKARGARGARVTDAAGAGAALGRAYCGNADTVKRARAEMKAQLGDTEARRRDAEARLRDRVAAERLHMPRTIRARAGADGEPAVFVLKDRIHKRTAPVRMKAVEATVADAVARLCDPARYGGSVAAMRRHLASPEARAEFLRLAGSVNRTDVTLSRGFVLNRARKKRGDGGDGDGAAA